MSIRYGQLPHAQGGAGDLWSEGWLPARPAAAKLGLSVSELRAAVRAGTVRVRSVGPGARLYEVAR